MSYTEADAVEMRIKIRTLNKQKPHAITRINKELGKIHAGFNINCLLQYEDTVTLMNQYARCMPKAKELLVKETYNVM